MHLGWDWRGGKGRSAAFVGGRNSEKWVRPLVFGVADPGWLNSPSFWNPSQSLSLFVYVRLADWTDGRKRKTRHAKEGIKGKNKHLQKTIGSTWQGHGPAVVCASSLTSLTRVCLRLIFIGRRVRLKCTALPLCFIDKSCVWFVVFAIRLWGAL